MSGVEAVQISIAAEVRKVDATHGVVFGWALICEDGGKPYFDLQGDNVSPAAMLKAAVRFADGARVAKAMHDGEPIGTVLFVMPLDADIAKSMGLKSDRTGMMIGMRPSPEVLAKFQSGEYTGFSIGGRGRRTPLPEES